MRKALGYTLIALSGLSWLAVPAVLFFDMDTATKVAWAGGFYLFSQVTWYLCFAVLGPELLAWWRLSRDWVLARWRRKQI